MTTQSRWLLPDGVDEQLPPDAPHLEQLRRLALDLFACWGYQLCMPPLVCPRPSGGFAWPLGLQARKAG